MSSWSRSRCSTVVTCTTDGDERLARPLSGAGELGGDGEPAWARCGRMSARARTWTMVTFGNGVPG